MLWTRACLNTCRLNREIREDAAAKRVIQAARAWLARRFVQKLRDEEERSRIIRSIAALNLQVRFSHRRLQNHSDTPTSKTLLGQPQRKQRQMYRRPYFV